MIEHWYNLTLQPGPRSVLVLDVSEGAGKIWPYLRSLTEGVLEALPANAQLRLFFLGNPQVYRAQEFAQKADEWQAANAGRGRVIGPVFERLAADPGVTVAVAGNGRIFDLDDWRHQAFMRNVLWCKVGPVGMTGGACLEESYTCEQLAERLNNPTIRVEIGGDGVMPFAWDDPSFRLQTGRLVGMRTEGTLRVGVLAADGSKLQARVILANGGCSDLAQQPGTALPVRDWVRIPTGEFNLLRQCLRLGHYQCPACNGTHTAGQYTCAQANGRATFATVAGVAPGGIGLLDTGAWDARVRPFACGAVQVNAQTVAVREAAGGVIYRFDAAAGQWQATERFAFSCELDKNLHALVL